MLTRIKINGFKSFHDFEMEFTPFTIIAGANASGKSNLFDAIALLSRLAATDIRAAFEDQRGTFTELFTKYEDGQFATEMEFEVDLLLDRKIKDNWGGEGELNHTRLTYRLVIERKPNNLNIEDLFIKEESLFKIKKEDDSWQKKLGKIVTEAAATRKSGGSPEPFISTITKDNNVEIKVRQDGKQGRKSTPANTVSQTVLSSITSIDFQHSFAARQEMISWRFIQFNPEDLREPTRKDIGIRDTISKSGRNLASALFRIKQSDSYCLKEISRELQKFIPNFTNVNVVDDSANNQYVIQLQDISKKVYSSRVLSEGTLRVLALCILMYDDKHTGLLCFEEPENGIHPQKISAMAELLKNLSSDFTENFDLRQVIVNTHSPVLVGYIVERYYEKNNLISIHFAQMVHRMKMLGNHKIGILATSIDSTVQDQRIERYDGFLASFNGSNKIAYTKNLMKKYLETSDFTIKL